MDIKEFIEKFAEAIEFENVNALTPETKFHELDGWSSLTVMYVISFFDEEFEKEISTNDIRQAVTIQDLYNMATA